jgi:hypothetical protein
MPRNCLLDHPCPRDLRFNKKMTRWMMGNWPNGLSGPSEGDEIELGYLESTAMRGGSKNLKRPGAIKMMMLFRQLFLVVDQQ